MNLNAQIVDVEVQNVPTKTGSYNKAVIAYKNLDKGGAIEAQTIVDFNDDKLFSRIKLLSPGDQISVDKQKNAQGYWGWVDFADLDSEAPSEQKKDTPKKGNKQSYDYEETQERIMRQSCLSSATQLMKPGSKPEDAIAMAELFLNYAKNGISTEKLVGNVEELDDDLPWGADEEVQ